MAWWCSGSVFLLFFFTFFGGWGASVLNLALNYVDDLVFWLEIWVFERTTQLGRKGAPGRVKPTIRLPSSSRDRGEAGGRGHTCLCVVQVGERRQIFHIFVCFDGQVLR